MKTAEQKSNTKTQRKLLVIENGGHKSLREVRQVLKIKDRQNKVENENNGK